MKKKTDKLFYTLWGLSFGVICACTFCGIYNNITMGIMLILWTLNGFLIGRSYEIKRQEEMLDDIIKSYENLEKTQELINEINQQFIDNMYEDKKNEE